MIVIFVRVHLQKKCQIARVFLVVPEQGEVETVIKIVLELVFARAYARALVFIKAR